MATLDGDIKLDKIMELEQVKDRAHIEGMQRSVEYRATEMQSSEVYGARGRRQQVFSPRPSLFGYQTTFQSPMAAYSNPIHGKSGFKSNF